VGSTIPYIGPSDGIKGRKRSKSSNTDVLSLLETTKKNNDSIGEEIIL
jgi:hypothetical protein